MLESATKRLNDKLEGQISQGNIKGNIFDEILRINKEMTQRLALKIDLRTENMVAAEESDDEEKNEYMNEPGDSTSKFSKKDMIAK